jgi:hypothetical protein
VAEGRGGRPGAGGGSVPRGSAAADRAAISRLADDVLPALVARLASSGLGELEVGGRDWRVRLRRDPAANDGPVLPRAHGPGVTALPRAGVGGTGADDLRGMARSPGVGYFSPLEGLGAGMPVRAGDVLGHVEVLGVGLEVTVPHDGFVGRVFVEPGQAVEYGQELVRVDALGADGPATRDDEDAPDGVDAPGAARTDDPRPADERPAAD